MRTRLALILVLVVLGAGVLVYVIAATRPFAADRAPGPVEAAIARRLVRLSIPRSERDLEGGAAAATVAMDGTAFEPAEVTVRAGDVVEWVNRDPFPHNVAADAAAIHSGDLDPDRTWRYRTVTRGTFHYVCTLHPGMAGVLHVK